MSTTAKRSFMNGGNSRSSFNMKDNWNDYGSSSNSQSSPSRPSKANHKYQSPKSSARSAAKGDAEYALKCESMATVPSMADSSAGITESALMLNQDPAIAAIAELSKDDKQAAETTVSNVSIVPQIHCDTSTHYQQQYAAYQTENGQLIYGSTPTKSAYDMTYDGYSTPNHNHQIMQQQQQQYVWQSTSAQQAFPAANDYASVAAANAAAALINTSAQQQNGGMNTPVQSMSSPPTAAAYYTPAPSYQSYVYGDPAMMYPGNMVTTTTTYSPMPNAQAIMSSPPQQQHTSTAAMFHTYQTPPPLTKYPHQHQQQQQQLYMTPPASGSPSDLLLNSNPLLASDRTLAACEASPQNLGQQQQQQQFYTTASPYLYTTSSYLASPPQANTAYQYQTPIMFTPPQAPQSTQMMLQTPTAAFQNLTINTNTPTDKYGNCNGKYSNIKTSHYNYKKNAMNKSQRQQQLGGYSPMSAETPSNMFSPMSATSPVGVNQQLCFDESTDDQHQHQHHQQAGDLLSNSPTMYRQAAGSSLLFPPTSYLSPMPTSSTMPFQQTPGAGAYDFMGGSSSSQFNTSLTPPVPAIYGANDYDSYGDEFVDENEPNNGGEDGGVGGEDGEGEQLACQICRGRRMCFCYFLKVRYYKFPSFFDLVDHQYKKWRSTMATKAPRKA